ncbi:MAG: hypothetical protein H6581_25470 [Bacteroidia bacterium]|nr:hypothetical protein [Bacteroidia bacterium]
MRTPSQTLSRLILSLTKGEKDAVVKYGGRIPDSNPKYLQLFKAMGQTTEKDESQVQKKLEKRWGKGNYAQAKSELTQIVLRIIREHEFRASAQLTEWIQNSMIFAERGLHLEALTLIAKGIEKAAREERFKEHLELLILEQECRLFTDSAADFHLFNQRIKAEETEIREKWEQLQSLKMLYREMYFELKKKQLSQGGWDASGLARLKQLVPAKMENKLKSKRAKRQFLEIKLLLSYLETREKNSLDLVEQVIELYQDNSFLMEDHKQHYLSRIYTRTAIHFQNGNTNEGIRSLNELWNLQVSFPQLIPQILNKYYLLSISVLDHPGLNNDKINLVLNAEKSFGRYSFVMDDNERLVNLFMLARANFQLGNFLTALDWLRKILAGKDSDIKQDLKYSVRILLLLVVSELANPDYFDLYFRKAYDYLRYTHNYHAPEKALFSYVRQVFTNHGKEKEKLQILKDELELPGNRERLQYLGRYFKLEDWVNRKLSRD